MSHTCPVCGQLCFCCGDIDDACNNFSEDALNCEHCCDEVDSNSDCDYENEEVSTDELINS